jgi:hypothetical protein
VRAIFIAAAILAISLCVGAQERPPNAVPPTNSKDGSGVGKLDAGQKANEAKQTGSIEPQGAPCNQTSPCYVVDQPQGKSKEQQAKDDSLDTLYRRYMWATIFGVIGAFIGLVVLICQTVISRTAANAAKIAAEAGLKQSEAIVTGDRAWIVADIGEIPDTFVPNLNALEVLDVRPLIRNSGRTPGWIKRAFIRYYLIAQGSTLPPDPDYQGALSRQKVHVIVPPNATIQPLHVPIPLSEFVAIRQGDPILYIYGFVDYIDFTQQERQTRFCFEYHVPRGFDSQIRGFYISVNVPEAYIRHT